MWTQATIFTPRARDVKWRSVVSPSALCLFSCHSPLRSLYDPRTLPDNAQMSESLKQDPPSSNEPSSSLVEDPQGLPDSSSPALHYGTTSAHSPVGTPPPIDGSPWSIMQDAVEEMRKLTEALHTISERPCNCIPGNTSESVPNDTTGAEKSTDSDSWKFIPDYDRTRYYESLEDPSWLPAKTRSLLGDLEDVNFDKFREFIWCLLHEKRDGPGTRHSFFKLRKHPMQSSASKTGCSSARRSSEEQAYDMVIGSSYDDCISPGQAWEWIENNWKHITSSPKLRKGFDYKCQKHIPKVSTSLYDPPIFVALSQDAAI